jgi:hypothetical protein
MTLEADHEKRSPIDKLTTQSHGPEDPSLQNIQDTAPAASKAEGEEGGDGAVCTNNHRGMSRGFHV